MADLAITSSQVIPGAGAVIKHGIAGAAVTAGDPIYEDATDNQSLKPAESGDTAAKAAVKGIALNDAADEQPVSYQIAGEITLGAGAAPGQAVPYVLSATAGGWTPHSEGAADSRLILLGFGLGSNKVKLLISNTGATFPGA